MKQNGGCHQQRQTYQQTPDTCGRALHGEDETITPEDRWLAGGRTVKELLHQTHENTVGLTGKIRHLQQIRHYIVAVKLHERI